jgi:hypothetical protein
MSMDQRRLECWGDSKLLEVCKLIKIKGFRKPIVLAAGVAVGVGVGVSAIMMGQVANATPPLLSTLSTGAKDASTELRGTLPLDKIGEGGVDGPVVALAKSAEGDFWTARDASGNFCLIVNPAGTDIFSVSCAPEDSFSEQGVWLSSESGPLAPRQVYLEAYLVPDALANRVDSSRLDQKSDVIQLSDNLFVSTTRQAELGSLAQHVAGSQD